MTAVDGPTRINVIRRVYAKAQRRLARRSTRTTYIRTLFTDYYGYQPKVGSWMNIYERWDGVHRRWPYEYAYALELEAEIVVNWLQVKYGSVLQSG